MPEAAALRKLALNDEGFIESVVSMRLDDIERSTLDPKTHALVRLGALVGAGAPLASYQWVVELARTAGASDDEIVDVLIAVAPAVGVARIVAAAPELSRALGYDIDAALTEHDR